jgi:hypothetical protein
MQKTAQCVECYHDPDAIHATLELDPPVEFMGAETRRFRIIDQIGGKSGRQIIADNGSWQHINGTSSSLPLDAYLSRYYGYHEPLVSRLRRLRGRWDDLEHAPRGAPYEMRQLWPQLDEAQRLLVALMADWATRTIEQAEQRRSTEYEEWEDA